MTAIISRSAWGARAARPGGNKFLTILGLAVHWEAGAPPASHAQCPQAVRDIQAFHMDVRGWNDIAYNFVACNHDVLFQGRVGGCAANGTDYGNDHFQAVCWLGGPGHIPADGARTAIASCRTHLLLDAKPIYPHSHFYPTACPGDSLRAWVASGANPPGGKPKPPVKNKHWTLSGAGASGPFGPAHAEQVLAMLPQRMANVQTAHGSDPDDAPDVSMTVTYHPKGA